MTTRSGSIRPPPEIPQLLDLRETQDARDTHPPRQIWWLHEEQPTGSTAGSAPPAEDEPMTWSERADANRHRSAGWELFGFFVIAAVIYIIAHGIANVF